MAGDWTMVGGRSTSQRRIQELYPPPKVKAKPSKKTVARKAKGKARRELSPSPPPLDVDPLYDPEDDREDEIQEEVREMEMEAGDFGEDKLQDHSVGTSVGASAGAASSSGTNKVYQRGPTRLPTKRPSCEAEKPVIRPAAKTYRYWSYNSLYIKLL